MFNRANTSRGRQEKSRRLEFAKKEVDGRAVMERMVVVVVVDAKVIRRGEKNSWRFRYEVRPAWRETGRETGIGVGWGWPLVSLSA